MICREYALDSQVATATRGASSCHNRADAEQPTTETKMQTVKYLIAAAAVAFAAASCCPNAPAPAPAPMMMPSK